MMPDYRFERECRTPFSEVYVISADDNWIGRVDLHFTAELVYGTLCVGENLTAEEIRELIEAIDEELVVSADVARDDFIVTVYQGREAGVFSDEACENEDDMDN